MPKQLSPWSKRSAAIGSILLVLLMLAACGDDGSDFATRPSGGSSSSLCKDCDDGSSSSKKQGDGGSEATMTSSSVRSSSSIKSSSSFAESSSSDTPKSSDSETSVSSSSAKSSSSSAEFSSSSVTLAIPCKTDSTDICEYKLWADSDATIKSVTIGSQIWMSGNLSNGTKSRYTNWSDAVGERIDDYCNSWLCNPGLGPFRGACPEGWHLPDTTEWNTLIAAVGGRYNAGSLMSLWNDYPWRCGKTPNAYGFSARMDGMVYPDGSAAGEGYYAVFWSATERNENQAYAICLSCAGDSAYWRFYSKGSRIMVRCLKDDPSDKKIDISSLGCRTETEDNCEYGELIDSRDGQAYKTVKIDTLWWMAENLNYETDSSFCYKDSSELCEEKGRLYAWEDAGTACPEGWHLPSALDVEDLYQTAGGRYVAGKLLKSTTFKDSAGTDAFGFSALPTGRRYARDGTFDWGETSVYMWTSLSYSNSEAWSIRFRSDSEKVETIEYDKLDALSVRCVKD